MTQPKTPPGQTLTPDAQRGPNAATREGDAKAPPKGAAPSDVTQEATSQGATSQDATSQDATQDAAQGVRRPSEGQGQPAATAKAADAPTPTTTSPGQTTQPTLQDQGRVVVIQPSPQPDLASQAPAAEASAWPLALTLSGALVLSALVLRMGRSQLIPSIKRWLPVAQIVIWGGAILMMGGVTLATLPLEWFYFELVLLILLTLINAHWLRSVLAGAALTLEGRLKQGDVVRVGQTDGELIAFGLRTVRLRAQDGTLHDIPNEQLVTSPIANLGGDGGDSACTLEITLQRHQRPAQALQLARQAAMLSPLSSPRHRPEVFLQPPRGAEQEPTLTIRGYAFDPQYQDHFKSDLTARVLKALEEIPAGGKALGESGSKV